jgi:protein O-mannosyl-transferase
MGLRNIVDRVVRNPVRTEYVKSSLDMLAIIQANPNYTRFHLFNKLVPYLNGQLYLALGSYDLAYEQFSVAIPMYGDTDAALSMMAEMANAGRPVEALLLFKQAEAVYKKQPDKYLKRSRVYYDAEFIRLRKMLDEGLSEIGIDQIVENQ